MYYSIGNSNSYLGRSFYGSVTDSQTVVHSVEPPISPNRIEIDDADEKFLEDYFDFESDPAAPINITIGKQWTNLITKSAIAFIEYDHPRAIYFNTIANRIKTSNAPYFAPYSGYISVLEKALTLISVNGIIPWKLFRPEHPNSQEMEDFFRKEKKKLVPGKETEEQRINKYVNEIFLMKSKPDYYTSHLIKLLMLTAKNIGFEEVEDAKKYFTKAQSQYSIYLKEGKINQNVKVELDNFFNQAANYIKEEKIGTEPISKKGIKSIEKIAEITKADYPTPEKYKESRGESLQELERSMKSGKVKDPELRKILGPSIDINKAPEYAEAALKAKKDLKYREEEIKKEEIELKDKIKKAVIKKEKAKEKLNKLVGVNKEVSEILAPIQDLTSLISTPANTTGLGATYINYGLGSEIVNLGSTYGLKGSTFGLAIPIDELGSTYGLAVPNELGSTYEISGYENYPSLGNTFGMAYPELGHNGNYATNYSQFGGFGKSIAKGFKKAVRAIEYNVFEKIVEKTWEEGLARPLKFVRDEISHRLIPSSIREFGRKMNRETKRAGRKIDKQMMRSIRDIATKYGPFIKAFSFLFILIPGIGLLLQILVLGLISATEIIHSRKMMSKLKKIAKRQLKALRVQLAALERQIQEMEALAAKIEEKRLRLMEIAKKLSAERKKALAELILPEGDKNKMYIAGGLGVAAIAPFIINPKITLLKSIYLAGLGGAIYYVLQKGPELPPDLVAFNKCAETSPEQACKQQYIKNRLARFAPLIKEIEEIQQEIEDFMNRVAGIQGPQPPVQYALGYASGYR